jgi:hypothetical protein
MTLFEKIRNKIKPKAKTACPNTPGNLAVYVLRSDTHNPIVNAKVTMRGPTKGSGSTDSEGWIIFRDCKPGAYQADVALPPLLSKFHLQQATQSGAVAADDVEILEFEASPPPVLKVKVVSRREKDGQTVEEVLSGVEIEARGPAQYSGNCAKDWSTFRDVAVGSYRVGVKSLGQHARDYAAPDPADVPLAMGETKEVVLVAISRSLKILKVDDHFAAGAEKLDITYSISGLSKEKVFLEIKGDHYGSNPIFKRQLSAAEARDGKHTIHWDGKTSCSAGELKDRYINPLFAPYKVHLYFDATYTDEAPFKVLYHSIALHWAPQTPDGAAPPASEKAKHAQYRLNELGWDAGPVDGIVGSATKAAIKRFQRSHYKPGTKQLLAENGTLDDDTFKAIQAAAARDRWEAGKNPLSADARLYVEENYFNDRGTDFVTTATPEFNSMDRKAHVEDKLGRPYLPLEVEVLLLAKNNSGVSAPLGVGPVTIAWEAADGPEDPIISAGNPKARAFVADARAKGFTGSARIDQTGDNAPRSLEGFRRSAPADNVKAWFPDDAASKFEPWKVRGYGTEARAGRTYHRAHVDAWADPSQHNKRLGRSGVYFRHSTKGGDDAKVRAAVTFEGRPNKDELVNLHKPYEAKLARQTGRWTVWRRAKMNAYCQQAAPSRASGSPDWGVIAAWWNDAFIEMEGGGAPAEMIDYATVVSEAKYKSTIVAMPASHRPPGVTAARHLKYRPGSLYGGPDIRQNPGESPQDYIDRASAAVTAWIEHPLNAILGVIHGHVRETMPEGLIVFDFRISEPITAKEWDPTKYFVFGGWNPTTNPAFQNQLPSTAGYVRLDGAVTMNVDNPFDVNCYVLHECGHARFLYHHHTGGGTAAGGASDNPTHHDPGQEQCTMSYAVDGHGPDDWKYPFCGKCILRLRGWKVA